MDKLNKSSTAKLGVNLPPHDLSLFSEYRDRGPVAAAPAPVPAMGAAPAPAMPAPAAPIAVPPAGPKFLSPVPQAPGMLAAQTNPVNAAMVANGRAPVPMEPAINAPAFTTSPGAAPRTNGVPFVMPPDPIQATTSPGASPAPRAAGARAAPQSAVKFSGDPLFPNAQYSAPNTREAPPKPITGGPTIPGASPEPGAPTVRRGTGFTVTTPPKPPSMAKQAANMVRGAAGPALGAAALIPEQMDVAKVAADPNATKLDVATQQGQALGRYGAAGVGAAMGGAAGLATGPFAPILAPIGAIAGGAAGYWAGDKFIEGARQLLGTDPAAPASRAQAPAAAAPVSAAPAAAPAQPYPETASNRMPAPIASPQAVATAVANPTNPNGAVTRIGNSYSGAPGISGDITINGKTPGGGFVANAGTGAPARLGVNPSIDMALSEARDAAMARGDYDAVRRSYGGDFGSDKVDPVTALVNNGRPMTTKKAAAIAALQANAGAADAARTTQQATARRAGVEAEGLAMDNKAKARLGVLQDALFTAKTPQEQAAAEEKLRAFQGKYEKPAPPEEYAYAPGGQVVTPDGVVTTQPGVIFNKRTGETRQPPAAPAKTYEIGKTYVDAKGSRAKWDGKQFVPA